MKRHAIIDRTVKVATFSGIAGYEELPVIDRRKALSARGRAKFWKAFNRFLKA